MTTRTWAADLLAHAQAVLDEAGVAGVVGTTDLDEAPSALDAGRLVVTVRPPRLELPTFDEVEAEHDVVLIAGPDTDSWAAWGRLDEALLVLLAPLAIDTVTPDAFTTNQGATYAAYVLTTTTHHTL